MQHEISMQLPETHLYLIDIPSLVFTVHQMLIHTHIFTCAIRSLMYGQNEVKGGNNDGLSQIRNCS